MSGADDLFVDRGISPRRVHFWLLHWAELDALAVSPASAASLREYLRREWIHLQDRHPSIACLCGPTDHEPPRAREQGASSAYGPASLSASLLKSDLEVAADALPLTWAATGRVYRLQSTPENPRYAAWSERVIAYLDAGGSRLAHPEPAGSQYVVRLLMARHTGWMLDGPPQLPDTGGAGVFALPRNRG